MKKLLIALLLISGYASAQPPGYTNVASRYKWIAGIFPDGLHLPASCGFPINKTGVWVGDGAITIDTCNAKLYIRNGGIWKALADSASVAGGWSLTGNAGTNPLTNFIGTTDSTRLMFRLNNQHFGYISPDGRQVAFGRGALEHRPQGRGYIAIGDSALYALDTISAAGAYPGDIAIGFWALKDYRQRGAHSGNVAIGAYVLKDAVYSARNVFVGSYSASLLYNSPQNAGLGVFVGEKLYKGLGVNVGVGSNAFRNAIDNYYNTVVGGYAGLYTSGYVDTLTIVNGGSGYGTGTGVDTVIITVSNPRANPINSPEPGTLAIFKAVVTGGIITNTLLVQEGKFYSSADPVTVQVTGNGTGAVLTATVKEGNENTFIGQESMGFNKYGSFNTALGRRSGVGFLTTERSYLDDHMSFLSYASSRSSSIPNTQKLTYGTAVGAYAKVGCSNCVILGRVVEDRIGIGTSDPDITKRLHVAGKGLFDDTTDVKVMLRYDRAIIRGTPAAGAALTTFTNYTGTTSYGRFFYTYGAQRMAFDNLMSGSAPITFGIGPSATINVQIDSMGLVAPNTLRVGSNNFFAADLSSVLDVRSTTRGALFPRMTTAQQDAIASPANGLIIYNLDSLMFRFYNGTVWVTIGGSSGGGGGSGTVTSFTATDGNGFDFSVASSTTTPTLTATTTVTNQQVMVSNSGAISGSAGLTYNGSTLTVQPGSNNTGTINMNNAAGTTVLRLGTYPGAPGYAGIWPGNITPSSANYAFLGDGSAGTFFNTVAGSSMFFRVNDATGMVMDASRQIGIGTTPTQALDVAGNYRLSGAFMPNNVTGAVGEVLAGAGTNNPNTWYKLSSGEYTPTYTAGTNVGTITHIQAYYTRTGDVVTVRVRFTAAWTSNNTTSLLSISLPIASNLAATTLLGEGSVGPSATYHPRTGGYVVGDATNDRVDFNFTSPSIGSPGSFDIEFQYKVI